MLSYTKELQIQYWTELRDYLKKEGSFLQPLGKPLELSWHAFKLRGSSERLEAVITSKGSMRVELYLTGANAYRKFSILTRDEAEAANAIGKLTWAPLPNGIRQKAYVEAEASLTKKEEWHHQFHWMKENLERMHHYFKPKLEAL